MKILGSSKTNLYQYNELIMMNKPLYEVVNYLFNNDLIDLEDDKYWYDDGNDYKIDMKKRYGKIYAEQNEIIQDGYRMELVKWQIK